MADSTASTELIEEIFAEFTPVTAMALNSASLGIVLEPSWPEIMVNAARDAASVASTTALSSLSESMPLPLSAVPAIAAMTAAILSVSTPEIPSAARSCGVNAGSTFSPAAVAKIDFTIAANAAISA